MSDEDNVDPLQPDEDDKPSRRDRFKDVFAKTKTKIQKHRERKEKQEPALPDDVNDFLAGGRTSSSSNRPSHDDSFLYDTTLRPPADDSFLADVLRPSTSDSAHVKPPQPSPRRIQVPRIDVSASQRFPNARPVEVDPRSRSDEHLTPEFRARSQSAFSSSSRKQRIRGLSVGFSDKPPVIIGEGGDEAETPPVEISRAKARARSLSPTGNRPQRNNFVRDLSPIRQAPQSGQGSPSEPLLSRPFQNSPTVRLQSQVQGFQPKSLQHAQTGHNVVEQDFLPNPVKRTQTGLTGLDKEFEMTLGLPTNISPQHDPASGQNQPLISPKPMRPPPSYTLIEQGRNPAISQPSQPQPPAPPQPQAQADEKFGRRKVATPPPQYPPSAQSQSQMKEGMDRRRPAPQPPLQTVQPRRSPQDTKPDQFLPSDRVERREEGIRHERPPPIPQPRQSPEERAQEQFPRKQPPPVPQSRRPPEEMVQEQVPPRKPPPPIPQPRRLPEEMRQERIPPPIPQSRQPPADMRQERMPPLKQPPIVKYRFPSPTEESDDSDDSDPRPQRDGSGAPPHTLRRKQFLPQLRQHDDKVPPTIKPTFQSTVGVGGQRFYGEVNPNNNPPEGFI